MSGTVFLFPRSQTPSEFREAARGQAAQENKTFKSFTRQELIKLANVTQRALEIGLINKCAHFEHEGGVMTQAFNARNPAEIVFSLFKDMREGNPIRYFSCVFLLNAKRVTETSNSGEVFARLGEGLNEACEEHAILYDVSAPKFVRS